MSVYCNLFIFEVLRKEGTAVELLINNMLTL